MRWLILSLALVGGGALVASARAPVQQETPKPEPEEEDFIPTEKVPADSAISFPVDI